MDNFNSTIEGVSLVDNGFITIDSLEPDYDFLAMQEMKYSIAIGKIDTGDTDMLIFDEYALENSPQEVFNQEEMEK